MGNDSSESSRIEVTIATLIGTGFEIGVFAPFLLILYTMYYPTSYSHGFFVAVLDWVTLGVLCLIVPVIYSSIVSPWLRPKRIVSPMLIQIFTVAIVGTIALVLLLVKTLGYAITNMGNYAVFLLVAGMVWALSFMAFGVLGFWQTLVVRRIVGLNDGKPNNVTYLVDTPFETVKKHATEEKFCDFWGLKPQDHSPELVLKSRYSVVNTLKNDVILVIAPSSEGKTTIQGSAFAEDLYDVAESDDATGRRDHIINDLVGSLPANPNRVPVKEQANLVRISSRFVEACTRSKITRAGLRSKVSGSLNVLMKIPRIFLVAIVITVFAWVLVNALFYFLSKTDIGGDIGPVPMVEINLAFFGIALGELLIPAWEQLRQGKPRLPRRSRG